MCYHTGALTFLIIDKRHMLIFPSVSRVKRLIENRLVGFSPENLLQIKLNGTSAVINQGCIGETPSRFQLRCDEKDKFLLQSKIFRHFIKRVFLEFTITRTCILLPHRIPNSQCLLHFGMSEKLAGSRAFRNILTTYMHLFGFYRSLAAIDRHDGKKKKDVFC